MGGTLLKEVSLWRTWWWSGGFDLFWHRLWKGKPPRLKTETDSVSETLCFLFVEIRTMDKVQKLNSNEHSSLV
jgi:hypothetical protein